MTWSDHTRYLLIVVTIAALILPVANGAGEDDEARLNQKLEQVRRQIEALLLNLQHTRESRDDELADLRSIERAVEQLCPIG